MGNTPSKPERRFSVRRRAGVHAQRPTSFEETGQALAGGGWATRIVDPQDVGFHRCDHRRYKSGNAFGRRADVRREVEHARLSQIPARGTAVVRIIWRVRRSRFGVGIRRFRQNNRVITVATVVSVGAMRIVVSSDPNRGVTVVRTSVAVSQRAKHTIAREHDGE